MSASTLPELLSWRIPRRLTTAGGFLIAILLCTGVCSAFFSWNRPSWVDRLDLATSVFFAGFLGWLFLKKQEYSLRASNLKASLVSFPALLAIALFPLEYAYLLPEMWGRSQAELYGFIYGHYAGVANPDHVLDAWAFMVFPVAFILLPPLVMFFAARLLGFQPGISDLVLSCSLFYPSLFLPLAWSMHFLPPHMVAQQSLMSLIIRCGMIISIPFGSLALLARLPQERPLGVCMPE